MRLIPTQTTEAKADGSKIIATIYSGPTTIELELSPHEAANFGRRLQATAFLPIEACRPQAEILAFQAKRRA